MAMASTTTITITIARRNPSPLLLSCAASFPPAGRISTIAIANEQQEEEEEPEETGSSPHDQTFCFFSLLRWCGDRARSLSHGARVHAHLAKHGLCGRCEVVEMLVRMYGKCGNPIAARACFDRIRSPDALCWHAMVSTYACNRLVPDALLLVGSMPEPGVPAWLLLPVLAACASAAEVKRVDAAARDRSDPALMAALLRAHLKFGSLTDAVAVLEEMPKRGAAASYTAMVGAYARAGRLGEGLLLFWRMLQEGVTTIDSISFLPALLACRCSVDGRPVHALALARGFTHNTTVGTALLGMYAKCGSLADSRAIFDAMGRCRCRDAATWNAMIAVYSRAGHANRAVELFEQMCLEGDVKPDRITYLAIIDAYARLASLKLGCAIHERVVATAGLESDIAVMTSLLSMYGKCGSVEHARRIFDKMPRWNLVTFNSMMAAYVQNGCAKEALELYYKIASEGITPDRITFLTALHACADLTSLRDGKAIHKHINIASRLQPADVGVKTALLNMYGKCGSVKEARALFDEMGKRDLIAWNAMITAYAQTGHAEEVLELVRRMDMEGSVKPNRITFLNTLNACSHAGLWDEGWKLFDSMTGDYGLARSVEHYVCMIDLLGRAGCLVAAEDLILNMPVQPDAAGWITLLGACRIHCDIERGEWAAGRAFLLDPENSAPFILLSNIYAAVGRWDDVKKLRKVMEERGVKKLPGCSWIEVEDCVHGFIAGDTSHPRSFEIYAELRRLSAHMKEAGYVPDTKSVLHDVEEVEKEHMLSHHSEKLAIAFGLVSTPRGTPLSIVKNLRVCPDCHAAIKLISDITEREITLRDANRFHHFKEGICSCGDYW